MSINLKMGQHSYAAKLFFVAVAYFLAASLGSVLSFEPEQATPVFPAAAIALVAILLWGRKMWPGIVLGAALYNAPILSEWYLNGREWPAIITVCLIVTGSTLQAIFGAKLITHFGAFPSSLEKEKHINLTVILGGPVSCVVAPTITYLTYYYFGSDTISAYFFGWFAWWVGDSVGVILFAAPILILLTATGEDSVQRRRVVPAAFLLLFIAVAMFFNFIKETRRVEVEGIFQKEVVERTRRIAQAAADATETLHAFEGLFYSSASVSQSEYKTFSKHMFSATKVIQTFEWAPRVPFEEKGSLEAQAKFAGYPDFQIVERSAIGGLVPVSDREEYFPVYYMEPFAGNEKAHGFDLGSSPARLAALTQARDLGQKIATSPITLVQDTEETKAFLLFDPIYDGIEQLNTVQERREQLKGFVLGVFRMDALINLAMTGLHKQDLIDMHIQDLAAPKGQRTLFGKAKPPSKWINAEETLTVGGREWHISFVPHDTFFTSFLAKNLWQLLIGGFLFSGLCALLILVITGRNSLMHRLVKERTGELMRARRHIDGISENAPVLLSYVGADQKFKFVNKCYERWFGEPKESFEGKHMREALGEDAYALVRSRVEAALAGQSFSFEARMHYRVGGVRYVQATYTPDVAADGQVLGFFASVEDLTNVKASEEKLRQTNISLEAQADLLVKEKDKAEAATRKKSEFLAVMSHEIRTPMNGILGTTDLLLETELAGKQRRYATATKKSADSLLHLINDILDFSKIEAGKLSLEQVPFDMRELVEDVIEFVAPKCRAESLELLVDYEIGTARYVKGDPGRVRQILLNLLSNAAKFTEQGHILMNVQSKEAGEGEICFRVEVQDTGIGITHDHQKMIFNKFDQADQSTTRKYGGTGLGLSICEKLTSMMDGTIGVTSALGVGSTFWFTVTLQDNEDKKRREKEEEKSGLLKGSRILVVDDNEIAGHILSGQLTAQKADVCFVDSASLALKTLRIRAERGIPFDIAILDYKMPAMDGETLARKIKSDDEIKDVEVVLNSTLLARSQSSSKRVSSVAGYLTKPMRSADMEKIISYIWDMKQNGEILPGAVTRQTVMDPKVAERQRPEFKGVHILVVEDNPINQMVATTILKKYGCIVMLANDGLEAVTLVKEHDFDMVIMDCLMPVMDGFEATKTIRIWEESSHRKRLPIIAFTANAMIGDKEQCIKAGMDDYISKPVSQLELERVLQEWLGSEIADVLIEKASAN